MSERDLIATPADGPGYACDASIDTHAWLERVTDEEIELDERPDWDSDDVFHAILKKREGATYLRAARDNVYNAENDFGSVFTWSVYAPEGTDEWYYADVFIAVCLHRGGDVRGNYAPALLYRVDCPAESGFLDWTLGWYVEKPMRRLNNRNRIVTVGWESAGERLNEELSPGYSSCPSSELYDHFGGEYGEWKDGYFTHEGTCERCHPYLNIC